MRLDKDLLPRLADAFRRPVDSGDLQAVDRDLIRDVAPLIHAFCRAYFRLEVEGLERVPPGKALVVINHNSGTTTLELLGFGARWYMERGTEEILYGLAHDALLGVPYLRNFLIRAGGITASQSHGDYVLQAEQKILVAPGGNLEAFRPFRDRHKIDFGGRTGFLRLALRNRAPILPTVFIGGHETLLVLHDGRPIARAFGLKKRFRLDTFPIFLALPWGVAMGPIFHLPLPAKCKVRVLEPISLDDYGPEDQDNPEVLDRLYRLVTGRMQDALGDLAAARKWPIIG